MNLFNFVLFLGGLIISHVTAIKYENEDDEEYIGNPDNDAIIMRPCEIGDIYCIRKYFDDHAKCIIPNGPLPDPAYRTQGNYYVPRSNFTAVLTEIKYTGFKNTRVEEFYINKRTNKLIMALNFRGIFLDIPSTYAKFYRRGREPIVTFMTFANVQIYAFTVTIIFPNAEDLELDEAEMTVFLQSASFIISPSVLVPPGVQQFQSVTSFFTDFPNVAKEVAFAEAFYYGSTYIQSNICDFGLQFY